MSISDEEMKTIQNALGFSIRLKRETQNSEEFRNVPSIRDRIDTEIFFVEQFRNDIQNMAEEELIDHKDLCRALSDATIFLTGRHPGRRYPDNSEQIMEVINKVKKKFCNKKDHEYY